MATSVAEVPVAKQLKSGLDMDPTWASVMQTQALQQKTPHRYQQSPVFSRKATTSSPAESSEHIKRHHHHHRRHHHHHRRRNNSEGDKTAVTPEERVHLLSELPWRKSGDFSTANFEEESVPSVPTINIPAVSPTLPRRYDNAPIYEKRERTYSMPTARRPVLTRRGKQRARSQDSSPATPRRGLLELPLQMQLHSQMYNGKILVGMQPILPHGEISIPESPETPLADSNGFLRVPTFPHSAGSTPHTIQRFLGIETDINHNYKGLTEEEIRSSNRMSRRGSSSSDSSTSTLT